MSYDDDKKSTSSRRLFLQQLALLSVPTFITGGTTNVFANFDSKRILRVLTCNIRVDLPEDEKVGNGWRTRKEACIKIIKNQHADVIGFQEVLVNQYLDLKDGLSDYFGIGFDGPGMDKHSDGYHGIAKNPIFFKKSRFELLTAGGYWLSENPLEAGSISWDSARARNAFWVRLRDKNTGKQFRVINLHLDHVKDEAKLAQIKLVVKESAQYQNDFIQILTGDFNAVPSSEVIAHVLNNNWIDSFSGQLEGTGHGFQPYDKDKAARAKKIDYIFFKGVIEARSSRIIKDNYKGVYPSDHYFLTADFEL